MDHWIYSAEDTNNETAKAEIVEKTMSIKNGQAKFDMLYTVQGYCDMLPVLWDEYQNLLENKGVSQDRKYLKLITDDTKKLYSTLHKAIYNKNSNKAYA